MYAKRIKEKNTSWGARLFASRFPSYGSVSFVGSVLGGARAAHSEAFAKIHAQMLLEGTKKRNKKDIQLQLDAWGATLSFSSTADRLVFSGHVRATHLQNVLNLAAESLTEPVFPASELTALVKRELGALALEAQDTRMQAHIALSQALFSPTHPNWMESTETAQKEIQKITSSQLRKYHEALIDRRTLIVSIAGDIEPKDAFALIEKQCKKLPQHSRLLPDFSPAAPEAPKREVRRIEHKASIDYMLGVATGITADHPEYAPLLLGLQVLGNPRGFSGRLMKTVREEEGLTYGVYSYLSGFTHDTDGYISAWGTFAPQLFAKGRTAIIREVRMIADKGISADEAKKHRELFESRWRVQLSNSAALSRAAHEVAAEGRGLSYLDTFPKKILALTAKEVNRALKKYLVPEKLSEAAAGPVKKDALG